MVMARSFILSGMCRPCAVVLVVIEEYGACRKALAVPGAYAFGGGRYIVGSPGRTIECDLYVSEFRAAGGIRLGIGLFWNGAIGPPPGLESILCGGGYGDLPGKLGLVRPGPCGRGY